MLKTCPRKTLLKQGERLRKCSKKRWLSMTLTEAKKACRFFSPRYNPFSKESEDFFFLKWVDQRRPLQPECPQKWRGGSGVFLVTHRSIGTCSGAPVVHFSVEERYALWFNPLLSIPARSVPTPSPSHTDTHHFLLPPPTTLTPLSPHCVRNVLRCILTCSLLPE